MKRWSRVGPLLLAAGALSAPQTPPLMAIRAGTLIDGTGAAPLKNAVILIQGERITAVGAAVAIPRGAAVIDLSAYTVLPGFIDAHVHLAFRTIGDGDWQHSDLTESPGQLALLGAAHAQQTLEAGFTTVRVVGTSHFNDIALRNAISGGWIPGPRILGAGTSFGITGGHCDDLEGYRPGAFGHESGIADGVADGVDQVREAVRYTVKYGADVIKICATGGVLSLTDSAGAQHTAKRKCGRSSKRRGCCRAASRPTRTARRGSRPRCAPASHPSSTGRSSTARPSP